MLQVHNLVKYYQNTPALLGVDLFVQRGETVVLMGPSGCGKSTLIRCINRLTKPDSGEIWFDGMPVHKFNEQDMLDFRRRIGFVFQHFNLISRLNVLDNTALGLVMSGMPRQQAMKEAEQALVQVGVGAELWGRLPNELSGGQRQRVGIARALAGKPALMLWDEPTASLDPILVQEVLQVMEDLATAAQAAMLVVTHEISFAARVADRILLMDQGRIVEEGNASRILTAPTSTVGLRYQKLWRIRYGGVLPRTTRQSGSSPSVVSGGTAPTAQNKVDMVI